MAFGPASLISLMPKAFISAVVGAMVTDLNFSVEMEYKKIKQIGNRKSKHCGLSSRNVLAFYWPDVKPNWHISPKCF